MDDSNDNTETQTAELSRSILDGVLGMLGATDHDPGEDFRHLLSRVHDLVHRKVRHEATKGETRDLLAEVLFSRLTRGFKSFLVRAKIDDSPQRAAEFLMGSLLTGAVLEEFAQVLDQVLMEMTNPHDYHLAGRADFISINELLQLLTAGKHTGRLILEKPDNQLDIYLSSGLIAFVDPHRFYQRMTRGKGLNAWREIPMELLSEANRIRTTEGVPILITMKEKGFLKADDFKESLRTIGAEQIYGFLLDEKECSFSYKALAELPEFAQKYHTGLPVMPLLLEGHRRLDDWRHVRRVFPDLREPIQPTPDLFARIAEMSLGVVEIKVLTLINGDNSFREVQEAVGLNDFDLGLMMVGFAREGILVPPGGSQSLFDDSLSAEESMEAAAEALDANESLGSIPESLDAVFGGEDDEFGLGFLRAARDEEEKKT